MSEQHPNPRNKVPGKNANGRSIHNAGRTKHSNASRVATARERAINSTMEPPNRAGRTLYRESLRRKAAK